MNKITIYVGVVALLVVPTFVHAGPIIRAGDSVSVDASQVLDGDFYAFAPTVSLSGSATNDVYIGGGTVTINAPVGEDLSVAGGVVQVHGDVADDVRVIGGEVTLAKLVKGDVVVMGGSLTILSTAVIEGDVLFLGNDLTIEGEVMGGIHGNAQKVRINSKVGGDISLTAQTLLTFGDNASVLGSVTYKSDNLLIRAQNAHIAGDIQRTESPLQTNAGFFEMYGLRVFILLFTSLAIFFVGRKYMQQIVEQSNRSFGVPGLVGLGVFILVPFISAVFMVSVIGVLIGVALFAFYIAMLIFAFALSGIFFGSYLQRILLKRETITLSTVFLGVLGLLLIGLVPYLGGIIFFAIVMITFGASSMALYRKIRS